MSGSSVKGWPLTPAHLPGTDVDSLASSDRAPVSGGELLSRAVAFDRRDRNLP